MAAHSLRSVSFSALGLDWKAGLRGSTKGERFVTICSKDSGTWLVGMHDCLGDWRIWPVGVLPSEGLLSETEALEVGRAALAQLEL